LHRATGSLARCAGNLRERWPAGEWSTLCCTHAPPLLAADGTALPAHVFEVRALACGTSRKQQPARVQQDVRLMHTVLSSRYCLTCSELQPRAAVAPGAE
jgi:hypothetical protein